MLDRLVTPPSHPHSYFLALVKIPNISLKGKDSRHFLLLYHKAIRLLSSLEQACEHMIYKHIFSSEVQVYTDGQAFDRSQLITPGLSPSDSL